MLEFHPWFQEILTLQEHWEWGHELQQHFHSGHCPGFYHFCGDEGQQASPHSCCLHHWSSPHHFHHWGCHQVFATRCAYICSPVSRKIKKKVREINQPKKSDSKVGVLHGSSSSKYVWRCACETGQIKNILGLIMGLQQRQQHLQCHILPGVVGQKNTHEWIKQGEKKKEIRENYPQMPFESEAAPRSTSKIWLEGWWKKTLPRIGRQPRRNCH